MTGTVVKIINGVTWVVFDSGKLSHRIRVVGIDAPETSQPFGQKSKERLSQSVAGKQVVVDWSKRDRYDRIVGKIIYDGKDVNLAQIRAGLAWWYRKNAQEQSPVDRQLYEAAEAKARADLVGLWAVSDPIPPWDWRKR